GPRAVGTLGVVGNLARPAGLVGGVGLLARSPGLVGLLARSPGLVGVAGLVGVVAAFVSAAAFVRSFVAVFVGVFVDVSAPVGPGVPVGSSCVDTVWVVARAYRQRAYDAPRPVSSHFRSPPVFLRGASTSS